MRKTNFLQLIILAALLAFAMPSVAMDEWRYGNVPRIVAFSDVHGDYDAMVATLQSAGLIGADLSWSGGDTHFVLVGDILDRGPDSRAAMDLLMQLEDEASAAGGRVHVLLGNHEIMNLIDDVRYVAKGEYAAFADDEQAADRDVWFSAWRKLRDTSAKDTAVLQAEFDRAFPAGFFAHRKAFAPDGQYGAWLFAKPMLVVINDTAFIHGGLSPIVAEIGLEGVNDGLLGDVKRYAEQTQVLIDAQLLLPTDRNRDHVAILERIDLATVAAAAVKDAITVLLQLNDPLFSYQSPHWYRGHTYCNELAEGDRIQAALQKIAAARVVVGHTPTPKREVVSRLGGRVIEVDTGMNSQSYGGSGHALVIEGDAMYVINEDPEQKSEVLPSARRVGARPGGALAVAQLEALLQRGEVRAAGDLLQVSQNGRTVSAQFIAAKRNGIYPDVAAYRLDRLLRLNMVPVTVKRDVGGKDGSLQFVPEKTLTEQQRQEQNIGGGAWCPLPVQWPDMSIFDALTANTARNGQTLLYDVDTWQLILNGFGEAFTTSTSKPSYIRDGQVSVGPSWKAALQSLDDTQLETSFGDVLDKRRIKALGKRRDFLLRQ